jgi:hypothetical protein
MSRISIRMLSIVVCFILMAGIIPFTGKVSVANASGIYPTNDLEYNFNDGTTMGWDKDWGDHLLSVEQSTYMSDGNNTGALAAQVSFTGGGFDEGNLGGWLGAPGAVVDLTEYKSIEYDLFINNPTDLTGVLKVETALNGGTFEDLNDWQEFNLANLSIVTINGKEYGKIHKKVSLKNSHNKALNKKLTIRMAGSGVQYEGIIYLDNVVIHRTNNILYDFNDGTTMNWVPAWGDALGTVSNSTYQENLGEGRLKVNTAFSTGGWKEANVKTSLSGDSAIKTDLTNFSKIEYDVLVPNPTSFTGVLKIATAFNDPWADVGSFETYDVSNQITAEINGVTYAKIHMISSLTAITNKSVVGELVVRLASDNSTYNGAIYLDNISIVALDATLVTIDSPNSFDDLSGNVSIVCTAVTPEAVSVNSVTVTTGTNHVITLALNSNGKYEGIMDASNEPEGFQKLTANLTASDNSTATKQTEVYIKNSKINVDIVSPTLDSVISNVYEVKATATNGDADVINSVLMEIYGSEKDYYSKTDMSLNNGFYKANFDSSSLPDGTYIIVVSAKTSNYTTSDVTEILVQNGVKVNSIVAKNGAKFSLDNKSFYFNGWNAYDLSYKDDVIKSSNDKAIIYTADGHKIDLLIKKDSVITYKEQIDRNMLEAKKLGATVLRTWGFNTENGNPHSFYNSDWTYNEEQFKEFDYVMVSAKRNGIKVIITLSNYWDDLGGIKKYTEHLGMSSKLKFFTEQSAKDLFKEYINKFTSRVNTYNNILYSEDPTIFAWDLMNEPRMDYNDDNSVDKSLFDPNGTKLGAWIKEMTTYTKTVDGNHMVTVGAESHGYKNPAADNEPWARTNEGYGDDPIAVLNQPDMDFLTFHPYPNANWLRYTRDQTRALIQGIVNDGHRINKPVVMEEWNIQRNEAVRDPNNGDATVEITDPNYNAVRLKLYKDLLKTFREAGGDGSNFWSILVNEADAGFSQTSYNPAYAVENDRPFNLAFADESKLMNALTGKSFTIPSTQEPTPIPIYVPTPTPLIPVSNQVQDEGTLNQLFEQTGKDNDGVKTAIIKVAPVNDADSYEVELPKIALLADNAAKRIRIETSLGTVVIPSNSLAAKWAKEVR